MTGVPVSGVPTARVKCSALLCPRPPPGVSEARSAVGHPPTTPLAPTPPGTRASRPWTPASTPAEARRALLTPRHPRGRRRVPQGPRDPCLPPRPPRPPASRGRTCARRRRRSPAPFGCAGAAPNPTHIATHSPLTSPSPRPAHVTAETHGFPQTPPPSPAARGRARAAGRGGNRASGGSARAGPPPSPRGFQSLGDARAVWPIVVPQGSPRPVVSRARPSPQARAWRSWLRAPSGRLARDAVCGAPGADRMFPPRPTPTVALPPSFLESPSRLSGTATAPPPPHPLLCGDGPDPGAPWPLGLRATGREGAGRPRGALCATPAAGWAEAGPARAPPPEVRHGRPSPRGAAAGPPRPGGSREAAALRRPQCGPCSPGRAGAAPRPRGASRPRAAQPAACASPHPGGPRLARAASAQTPSPS